MGLKSQLSPTSDLKTVGIVVGPQHEGSVPGLADLKSVQCAWVRQQVSSLVSVSVQQHVELYYQACTINTLCCGNINIWVDNQWCPLCVCSISHLCSLCAGHSDVWPSGFLPSHHILWFGSELWYYHQNFTLFWPYKDWNILCEYFISFMHSYW